MLHNVLEVHKGPLAEVTIRARFCPECGTPLEEPANRTLQVELPAEETGPVPVSMQVSEPRWFGVTPPSFLLGLAGAGLTVALKDFIVAFIGWLVLMGENGIRLGDWVEINGVTGEVVELNMFHTVLLETGNWTDSGHPTGRRVTFTNSFAIEGHYFNFSTSGQWLWDELQVVLPAGQDPYPIVDAIQEKVAKATAESAKQAEQEWKSAARSRDMRALSAAPAINVKPVIGGVEIAVRYITRANERYQLRAKLNQAAVDLLGQKAVPPPAAPASLPPSN